MTVYQFSAENTAGKEVSLDQFEGKVLVIANTASKCGLTPQYGDLQKLYEQYHDQGLEIIGFPCNQFGAQEQEAVKKQNHFARLIMAYPSLSLQK
ncbi:glutathione peroxidase [Paenibacillus pini JCM 16418]|uniref:Glutathione peroxidase n=1 Tax=Paenibacillus pini JCM 16418 TaxID=1236976 RepID=W7YNY3_9BACL|nr:glutathione peroxidase [Paenibacillus pini JCM 16418]